MYESAKVGELIGLQTNAKIIDKGDEVDVMYDVPPLHIVQRFFKTQDGCQAAAKEQQDKWDKAMAEAEAKRRDEAHKLDKYR